MLRERWTEQGAVLVQLGDAERSLRSELQSITSSHSLVSQDKDFQSREVLELRRQLDDASRQADTDRERALSAELKVCIYTHLYTVYLVLQCFINTIYIYICRTGSCRSSC